MSAESFANQTALGRYQPEYSELRDLSVEEIEKNLLASEMTYRGLANGTDDFLDEVDDPAVRAWLEFVAEEGCVF